MGMPIRPSPTKAICDTDAYYPQHRPRTIKTAELSGQRSLTASFLRLTPASPAGPSVKRLLEQ
jgi:hypothetical protein